MTSAKEVTHAVVPRHRPVGCQWGKWDLHFHTPSSFDYLDKSVPDEQIIETLVGAGLELVAITDHHVMDVARIKRLQQIAGDRISILPGIEFRSDLGGKETVHLIGIFPEDCKLDDVWTKLSGKLELTPDDLRKKGGDEKIYVVFRDACDVIHDLGGIVSVHAGTKSNTIEKIGNKDLFKQRLKTDLARDYIDVYEVGKTSDIKAYEEKVFPAIGKEIPLVICSDNHDIKKYELKTPCWVKGDPCFATFQQLKSDPTRAYIGNVPPEIDRVEKNKTKYISEVAFEKVSTSLLAEDWFSGTVPINTGLVAIIGNKGGGKTALAESCGLLGNCELEDEFSFLNEEKFRQVKTNKAEHFNATLTWVSGHKETRRLSDETDPAKPRAVSYIPQNYLEKICNEVANLPGSRFDLELKAVIFSHVAEDKKLGASSLDELLEFKTTPLLDRTKLLRADLHGINQEIVALEAQGSPEQRQLLLNLEASKRRELEAHDKIKPKEVVKPETDPKQKAEMDEISAQISAKNQTRDTLGQAVKDAEGKKRTATLQVAMTDRILSSIKNFEAQHQTFLANITKDCAAVGIDPKTLVTLVVHPDDIQSIRDTAQKTIEEQEAGIKDLGAQQAVMAQEVRDLTDKLDAPSSEYQAYLEALRQWEGTRAGLVGDDESLDTINNLKKRISDLDGIPDRLKNAEDRREAKVREVFREIKARVDVYRELYQPVQEFIAAHPLAKNKFKLDFDARIVATGLADQILKRINQGRKGSFSGVEEGQLVLKRLVEGADFDTENGVIKFVVTLLDHFSHDHRVTPKVKVSIQDQLRGDKDDSQLVELLDAIFGLAYLSPKYQLRWSGKDLDELSPGEKGTLLLIFYLLIDKRDIPLIIDQPEENLDNQTVFDILVPCLREARKKRQVIVVTHNPNLAIVCDADQIIHSRIDKTDRNRVTYTSGAIENPTINRLTIDVLEGTRPAFDHRDSKYQDEEISSTGAKAIAR